MSDDRTDKERHDQAVQNVILEIEKVKQATLMRCSKDYNEQAEDPGWEADLYDDMLESAITEAAMAINIRKQVEREMLA